MRGSRRRFLGKRQPVLVGVQETSNCGATATKWYEVVQSAWLGQAEPGDTLFAPALLTPGVGFQPAESGDTKMGAITSKNFLALLERKCYNTSNLPVC